MLLLNEIEYAKWVEMLVLFLFEFQGRFHSVKMFVRVDFLELRIMCGRMRSKKNKEKKPIKIALYQQLQI